MGRKTFFFSQKLVETQYTKMDTIDIIIKIFWNSISMHLKKPET